MYISLPTVVHVGVLCRSTLRERATVANYCTTTTTASSTVFQIEPFIPKSYSSTRVIVWWFYSAKMSLKSNDVSQCLIMSNDVC